MNTGNGFDLLMDVFSYMSNQLGGIVPKAKNLVVSFRLEEG